MFKSEAPEQDTPLPSLSGRHCHYLQKTQEALQGEKLTWFLTTRVPYPVKVCIAAK